MIVLDTNVLSEMMRPEPSRGVSQWLGELNPEDVFTTAITQAEILSGLAILPTGKRRAGLERVAQQLFVSIFGKRILPFDGPAASYFARVVSVRRQMGRPIGVLDAQIASVTMAAGASLATRNVADFQDLGLQLLDPWNDNN